MDKTEKARLLKQSLIFSSLSAEDLDHLAGLSVERRFKAGEYVFWEGAAPEWFYIVASGRIKVVKHSSLGKEFIVAFFGPGEMFGEVAVFENMPYPASSQAAVDLTVLGTRSQDFLAFLAGRPRVALAIISILGGRLREAQSRLRDLAGERVEQRIARTLHMLASKIGTSLPFTRQDIADMAGTTIETTIRVMSRLKEGGMIRSSRGKITILDLNRLRMLGEGPPEP